jgi:hypothetical protein
MSLFFLLTFLLFVRLARPVDSPGWMRQVFMMTTYLGALLSKEPAPVLPALAAAHFGLAGLYEHQGRDAEAGAEY